MRITRSEENYLKAIYHLGDHGSSNVSTNALAGRLETKASSVTDMIQKLSDKGLVDYRKYKGVKLTQTGKEVAIRIIRKHRLWEVFLVDKLHFSWDEVHEVAEQLEHVRSEKLVAELDAFLGYPSYDPHGDPIPDTEGNINVSDKLLLANVKPGTECVCTGVNDSSAEFLKLLNKRKIALGTRFKVVDTEPFDHSMTIILDGQELVVSDHVTQNLFVKTN